VQQGVLSLFIPISVAFQHKLRLERGDFLDEDEGFSSSFGMRDQGETKETRPYQEPPPPVLQRKRQDSLGSELEEDLSSKLNQELCAIGVRLCVPFLERACADHFLHISRIAHL
jgi:hypothetical protein